MILFYPNFKMNKFLLVLFCSVILTHCSPKPYYKNKKWEQSELPSTQPSYQIFLLGDAGKPSHEPIEPTLLLTKGLKNVNKQSCTIFLGDNIYNYGLVDEVDIFRADAIKKIETILSVFEPEKDKVIFVPGNHDWGMGSNLGYDAVKRQEKYIEEKLKDKEAFLPGNGCPGPFSVTPMDDILIIAIDTQWWLHEQSKPGIESDCLAKTDEQFLQELQKTLDSNKDKKVVVIGHHPIFTNGAHGGKYTLKDHIFPLTMMKPNLYIPLPIIGSLYPLGRKWSKNIQDLTHKRYKELKNKIEPIFASHPQLIYAAGHEHGLQYFNKNNNHFLVSGSTCKSSPLKKGKGSEFIYSAKGMMVLSFYNNNEIWLETWKPINEGNTGEIVFRKKLEFGGK